MSNSDAPWLAMNFQNHQVWITIINGTSKRKVKYKHTGFKKPRGEMQTFLGYKYAVIYWINNVIIL